MGESKREKERVQDFFRRSTEFRQSEFVGPRTKSSSSRRGLRMCIKKEGFHQRCNGRDFGEIKVFEFMRCSRDLLPFYYARRGRGFSYFGLFPTLELF